MRVASSHARLAGAQHGLGQQRDHLFGHSRRQPVEVKIDGGGCAVLEIDRRATRSIGVRVDGVVALDGAPYACLNGLLLFDIGLVSRDSCLVPGVLLEVLGLKPALQISGNLLWWFAGADVDADEALVIP
jgi:hypothetical protein